MKFLAPKSDPVPTLKIAPNTYLAEELNSRVTDQINLENKTLIPLFGNHVQCGLFGISDDFIEKYQSLDSRFIKNKESTFFLKATGNSMEPTIFPGEILVVDRSIESRNGKVCIVAYNGALTCKRVFLKKTFIILHSDNRLYTPIKITEPDSVILWGVVIARVGDVN